MVHQYDHRHSSYHPASPFSVDPTGQSVKNKNYQQQQQQDQNNSSSIRSAKNRNNNNNNNSSSSTSSSPTSSNAVNDNDTFVRFWPQSANNGGSNSRPCSGSSNSSSGGGATTLLLPPCYPSGPISGGTSNSNNSYSAVENDVRWSKLLRHDGTPTKVENVSSKRFDYRHLYTAATSSNNPPSFHQHVK